MAESGAAAGQIDQRHKNAQQHKEQKNAGIVSDGSDQPILNDHVKCADGGKPACEQRADHNADKQRRIGFLGDEGQCDGDDWRNKRPESTCKVHEMHFSLNKYKP